MKFILLDLRDVGAGTLFVFHFHSPLASEAVLLFFTLPFFLCCIVGEGFSTTPPMLTANHSEPLVTRDLFDRGLGPLNLGIPRTRWSVAKSTDQKSAELPTLPAWGFTDQNGSSFQPRPGARFQVYVLGDRKISKATQRWGDELAEKLPPSCQVVRVLDLKGLVRIAAPLVVRGIRKQLDGKKIRVFLDWKGLATAYFNVPPDTPSIVCLDESGAAVRVVRGKWNLERSRSIVDLYATLAARGV